METKKLITTLTYNSPEDFETAVRNLRELLGDYESDPADLFSAGLAHFLGQAGIEAKLGPAWIEEWTLQHSKKLFSILEAV